jgi:hypothetical protein
VANSRSLIRTKGLDSSYPTQAGRIQYRSAFQDQSIERPSERLQVAPCSVGLGSEAQTLPDVVGNLIASENQGVLHAPFTPASMRSAMCITYPNQSYLCFFPSPELGGQCPESVPRKAPCPWHGRVLTSQIQLRDVLMSWFQDSSSWVPNRQDIWGNWLVRQDGIRKPRRQVQRFKIAMPCDSLLPHGTDCLVTPI